MYRVIQTKCNDVKFFTYHFTDESEFNIPEVVAIQSYSYLNEVSIEWF